MSSRQTRTERAAGLRKYTAQAPASAGLLHSTTDLGHADFQAGRHAALAGQLNERTIRYGLVDTMRVADEHSSAQTVISARLSDTRALQGLQAIAAAAAQRQLGRTQKFAAAGVRRSGRAEATAEAWLAALANPHVPLSSMAAAPSTLRGDRLLEGLTTLEVTESRALWAVRATGPHDAWTRQFTQFAEQALTAAMAEDDAAAVRRWAFCGRLLHAQYAAGLVDQRHVVSWLVGLVRQSAGTCMAALPLVREYVAEISRSRTPLRKLVAALVQRIEQSTGHAALDVLRRDARALLAALLARAADAFVEPTAWEATQRALGDDAGITQLVAHVAARNGRFGGSSGAATDSGVRAALQALGPGADVDAAFAAIGGTAASVRAVCTWAVGGGGGAFQWRQLAAARLARLALDGGTDVQAAVVRLLDMHTLPSGASGVRRVCALLERLRDAGAFSVTAYLQLLTARGDLARAADARSRRHAAYACGVAASVEERVLRRVLLSDSGAAQPGDESEEAALRAALAAMLPFVTAYTCAAPLRARARGLAAAAGEAQWWLGSRGDALDAAAMPSPAQLACTALAAESATRPCTDEWLAPLADHPADARVLGGDLPSTLRRRLRYGTRATVDAALQHVLAAAFAFVVGDVAVGADNWRVIVQPGAALLNRRQAAAVARALSCAGAAAALLDFLLWLLRHTRDAGVAALAHCALRGGTYTWRLLGRLHDACGAAERACAERGFDFEALRTARCWALHGAEAWSERLADDYARHVASARAPLLQPGHAPQPSAAVELRALAVQLVRARERAAPSDADEWAVAQCFRRLARGAAAGVAATPDARARAQTVFVRLTMDAAQAALQPALGLAPLHAAERVRDEAHLRMYVELCARLVRWFAHDTGLLDDAALLSSVVLDAQAVAMRNASAPAEPALLAAHVWTAQLLAAGCLRLADLLPWLVARCRETPLDAVPQHALVAGIVRALGWAQHEPTEEDVDSAGVDSVEEGPAVPSATPDGRLLCEALETEAAWAEALAENPRCSAQAVDVVLAAAAAAGNMRAGGAAQSAGLLLAAALELAQSPWVQAALDRLPGEGTELRTALDVYHSSVEGVLRDGHLALPTKRAVLRALLTLSEGVDPEADGFSAMTTPEVAHRLHRCLQRFWCGPAALELSAPAVSRLAAVLNALLLFASEALRESEASTDAFAVAAGATASELADATAVAPAATSSVDVPAATPGGVQFVTNASAHLAACVLAVVCSAPPADCGDEDPRHVARRRCDALAAALSSLSADVLLLVVERLVHSLLRLDPAYFHAAAETAAAGSGTSSSAHVDSRVATVVAASAANTNVDLLIANDAEDADGLSLPSSGALVVLSSLVQRLVAALASAAEASQKPSESLVLSVRDYAAAVLGQLQAIALRINPLVATRLALTAATEENATPADPLPVTDVLRLRLAILWRLQAVRPLWRLLRAHPDEFGASEWLLTLIALGMASVCQDQNPNHIRGTSSGGLLQLLLDFAAVINEGLTAPMRKHTLAQLRLVSPMLHSMVRDRECAEVLSRLFPFEVSTALTCDLVVGSGEASTLESSLLSPWAWVEGLEFAPLAALPATMPPAGLEGMTPFTLRGVLEHEMASTGERAEEGYVANVGLNSSSSSARVGSFRRLQYLENPYFPMLPAMLFPLADTPISWNVFGAKRRRLDAESRLVWRSQCEATFAP
ncbi:RNA polymerase II mediator complex subunit [Coemansia guatemalensis]|uniref:Mediator of RNA polymerase II transcription subunit 12 n=1 Tax=Coemansia guatemalensis TaxID=2761395 RepID=A0A9W8LWE1_9FUNG|nr:RNA polymerase II mediator complex subunit [Coemansia guatemalensis]